MKRMAELSGYKHITTNAGDTFDSISYAQYQNEKLSSEIIALNPGFCDVLIFGEGVDLTIPVYDTEKTPDTLPPWRMEK